MLLNEQQISSITFGAHKVYCEQESYKFKRMTDEVEKAFIEQQKTFAAIPLQHPGCGLIFIPIPNT